MNAATLNANPQAAAAHARTDWQNEVREWAKANGFYGRTVTDAIDDAALYGEFEGWYDYALDFMNRDRADGQYELQAECAADRARGYDR